MDGLAARAGGGERARLHSDTVAAEALDLAHDLFGGSGRVCVIDHHAAPRAAQRKRDGLAQPAAAARDDAHGAVRGHAWPG